MKGFLDKNEKLLWVLALGFIVFFGRWRLLGLTPDAALYAGLSYKVFLTGEPWLISGTVNRFPIYFEHPPYFFQWGSWVFSVLGVSEGSARAIGAIPGFLGFAFFMIWISRRWSATTALVTGLLGLLWGHYTKYASTSMLEAPLSLAVILAVMATFELHWRESLGVRRVLWWLVLYSALFLATAAKGVAGLGVFGGLSLSIFFALLFSERSPFKVLMGAFSIGLCLLVALAPFALWFHELSEKQDLERFVRYISDQVFRSMTTNRGEAIHSVSGDRFYYLKLFLRDALIGFVAFISGAGYYVSRFILVKKSDRRKSDRKNFAYVMNALSFILSFSIPFSLVTFQLPHYVHPVYLAMLLPGAAMGVEFFERKKWSKRLPWISLRWALIFIVGILFPLVYSGVSTTTNRGQNFIAISQSLEQRDPGCELLIADSSVDAYSAEAFAMWYFRNRPWMFTKNIYSSASNVPAERIYWDPRENRLLGGPGCR